MSAAWSITRSSRESFALEWLSRLTPFDRETAAREEVMLSTCAGLTSGLTTSGTSREAVVHCLIGHHVITGSITILSRRCYFGLLILLTTTAPEGCEPISIPPLPSVASNKPFFHARLME